MAAIWHRTHRWQAEAIAMSHDHRVPDSCIGAVRYALDPATLGLAPGHHVLTLHSMLITTIADFRSR